MYRIVLIVFMMILNGCFKVDKHEPCVQQPEKQSVAKKPQVKIDMPTPNENKKRLEEVLGKIIPKKNQLFKMKEPEELCIKGNLYHRWNTKSVTPAFDESGTLECKSDFFDFKVECIYGFEYYIIGPAVVLGMSEGFTLRCGGDL